MVIHMVIFDHFKTLENEKRYGQLKNSLNHVLRFFMSVTYKKQQSVQLCINENRIKTQQPVQLYEIKT